MYVIPSRIANCVIATSVEKPMTSPPLICGGVRYVVQDLGNTCGKLWHTCTETLLIMWHKDVMTNSTSHSSAIFKRKIAIRPELALMALQGICLRIAPPFRSGIPLAPSQESIVRHPLADSELRDSQAEDFPGHFSYVCEWCVIYSKSCTSSYLIPQRRQICLNELLYLNFRALASLSLLPVSRLLMSLFPNISKQSLFLC